ncbi:MAG: cell wall-binding protein [Clostridium sp.]
MKKNLKKLLVLIGIAVISMPLISYNSYAVDNKVSNTTSDSDGWHSDEGKWRYFKNGSFKTGWFQDNDGTWYFFNNDGIMQTGWILDRGNWYYMYNSGAMAHDCYIGKYYLNNNGAWTNNIPDTIKSNIDINSKIENLGYSSKERIVDYNSTDAKYSEGYRYTWYDGKEGSEQYATVNVFDSGACSILIRKNCMVFNEKLKEIFKCIFPGNEYKLLNDIDGIKEDKSEDIDGRHVDIKIFDDSIGIVVD